MASQDGLTIVIFGATGDLAQKKIIPALMDLYIRDLLPEDINIVGFSRKDLSDNDYREFVANSINKKNHKHSEERINSFLKNVYYKHGDVNDVEKYRELEEYLDSLEPEGKSFNKIFYLAVPPNLYNSIFENLYTSKITVPCVVDGEKWRRILVEKPFGSNVNEAKILDKTLGKLFDESQIFRIDHYLAKETIQNILTFRFANAIFEPLWNKENIEFIKITLHEIEDSSQRVAYYDDIGALRDVGQNHLLQMLALVLMDDPEGISAEAVRAARLRALSGLILPSKDISKFAFRAQYEGYTRTDGISKSKTETFFRLILNSKDKRWSGVPFYLESGKALKENLIEIEISFRDRESFVCVDSERCNYNNTLRINIKPREDISLEFFSKKPGLSLELQKRKFSFKYGEENDLLPEAYEKILYDCIRGDQTLFTSTEEVATEWRIISEVLKGWKNLPLITYKKGEDPNKIKNTFTGKVISALQCQFGGHDVRK